MNIVYIQRDETANLRPAVRLLKRVQNYLYGHDQDGFFEHAVQSIANGHTVQFMYLHQFITQPLPEQVDAVIINMKCTIFKDATERHAYFREFLQDRPDIVRCLFFNTAQASYMFPDDVLDNFDVIFKREPYKDKNRYAISDTNKEKIFATMIHCPFVPAPRRAAVARLYNALRPAVSSCRAPEEKYEVGFSGVDASTHTLRREAWQAVVEAGFVTIGGLQPNPNSPDAIPAALQAPRLQGRAYRNALCQAKINLALDGIGEYTFRHQELLCLGKFILTSTAIRESDLPIPLEEGTHYVAFDSIPDMLEKIRYYLEHEDERYKIAQAGQAVFREYYDPVKHGAQIAEAIRAAQVRRKNIQ
jgi:hypothetical protein